MGGMDGLGRVRLLAPRPLEPSERFDERFGQDESSTAERTAFVVWRPSIHSHMKLSMCTHTIRSKQMTANTDVQ